LLVAWYTINLGLIVVREKKCPGLENEDGMGDILGTRESPIREV
jgi:hypothetical protein